MESPFEERHSRFVQEPDAGGLYQPLNMRPHFRVFIAAEVDDKGARDLS